MKSIFTEEYGRLVAHLIEARRKAQLTQQQLAQKLDRPQSFVSKYERAERRLDVVEFLTVARALGVHAAELIDQLEKPATSSSKKRRA